MLTTEFGLVSHAGGGRGYLDSSPANIRTALEGSLQRLGVVHIDLYYQHRVDPLVQPGLEIPADGQPCDIQGHLNLFGAPDGQGEVKVPGALG